MANDTSKLTINGNTYDIKDPVARNKTEINDTTPSASTTYSSDKIIELDDNILAQIAEPFVSGRTYYYDDVFEYNGDIFKQGFASSSIINDPYTQTPVLKMPALADMYKGCWIGTTEQMITDYDATGPFIFTTDDNEKILMNIVMISLPKFDTSDNKWKATIRKITNDSTHSMYGIIVAKNDLTGIENVDDAERLLKIEKVEGEYVVTYANSVMSKLIGGNYDRFQINNVSKGTTNTAYIRAYAVFNYGTDNEIVAYTPCRVLTWEEE